MKKNFYSFLVISFIIIAYLLYDEYNFSPLKDQDFQKIFKGNITNVDKICSKDMLGLSIHGEYFDIFLYQSNEFKIKDSFSNIKKWENNTITQNTLIKQWHSFPLDSQALSVYKLVQEEYLNKNTCFYSLKNEINNANNFYSYIYFNEFEKFLLIYCINKKQLFYIRKNGF